MRVVLLFFILCFSFGCSTSKITDADIKRFRSDPPPRIEVKRQIPERWTLPNGLTVLFIEDRELPLVSGSLFIPGGVLWESPLPTGSVSAMGSLMRLGGTKKLPPEELDEKLRQLAAEISSSFGRENGTMQFEALSGDVDEVFGIFHDVVLEPRFDEQRLGVFKTQVLDGISRRKDELGEVARVTAQIVLRRKNPQSGVLRRSDVRKLTRLDLLRAHREFVRPDGAYFTITGDISREEAEVLVKNYLGKWQKRPSPLGPPAPLSKPHPPGIYFVEGDFNQALIYGVQPGPKRHTKDRFPIKLFNAMMGDGFDSRIIKTVRSDLGLAYSVTSMVIPDFQQGKNLLYAQTKTESVLKALQAMIDEIQKIRTTKPPTPQELATLQQGAQSSFVFRFASPSSVLGRQVTLELFDYPEDYDETYIPNIFAVTPQQIVDVSERWWKLDELRLVIVGNRKAYQTLARGIKDDPLLSKYRLRKIRFDEVPRL